MLFPCQHLKPALQVTISLPPRGNSSTFFVPDAARNLSLPAGSFEWRDGAGTNTRIASAF